MDRTAGVTAMESTANLVEYCYASAYRALEEDQDQAAERLFGILAVMDPRDERGWIGMALLRERRENWRAAGAVYGIGSAFVPSSSWCHFGRGRSLLRQGRFAEAEMEFRVAESQSDDQNLLAAIEEEKESQ